MPQSDEHCMPARFILAAVACCLFYPVLAGARTVHLYRDTYGVPHVYAETEQEAAFGIGYAQAEDRLEDLYRNVRIAIGSMAEAFGPEYVEMDYVMRLIRNEAICREGWESIPEHVRILCEHYVAGVNAFIQKHPERVPAYAVDVKPWHCLSVGRTMVLQWIFGRIQSEMGRKGERPEFASNAWAVSPKRSADNCAVLLADPHLTWEDLAVFHEIRVHGGTLVMNGFCVVGTPLIAFGHGQDVGWACTTGGADTADVFAMKLRLDTWGGMPTMYEYEGKWEYARLRIIQIPVKGEKRPRVMPGLITRRGPVLEKPDMNRGVAYAVNSPLLEDINLVVQIYDMVTAPNAEAFYTALCRNHFMEQNVIYADRQGNIGYVRVGRAPIRAMEYDWRKPVPGNIAATQWRGIHPLDDHVRIVNPEAGYLQNCNISPALMMPDSPLTPEKYLPYLYDSAADHDNFRGKRALQLLAEHPRLTHEEAVAVTMDVYDLLAPLWKKALQNAAAVAGSEKIESLGIQTVVEQILSWDGNFTQSSITAPIVERWRLVCQGEIDVEVIADGAQQATQDQMRMLELLADTLKHMQTAYGSKPVTWGDIKRVGRGGMLYPYDGADFGKGKNGTETLRNVAARETPPGSGYYTAHNGTMAAMLMFMKEEGIESYSCIPWGQSNQPDSRHYMDQGRNLFSQRKMKPSWFKKDELLQHLESEKVLKVE